MNPTRDRYGPGPRQYGEWWTPPGTGPFPLVVLVHGGFWRARYDLTLEHPVASALTASGFLVWNVEYAPAGSVWPATLLDVAAAYDHAVLAPSVDTSRIAVVGHSAGGHLALWLASRSAGTPGGAPTVPPTLVVGQAPVACLTLAAEQGLGGGAVTDFVGGSPYDMPSRYAEADPFGLDLLCPAVLLHADDDEDVPVSQSETYAAAKGATLGRVPDGHYGHLDPTSEAITALHRELRILMRDDPAHKPFVQRTSPLGITIDVSNVAEAIELLEGPDAR